MLRPNRHSSSARACDAPSRRWLARLVLSAVIVLFSGIRFTWAQALPAGWADRDIGVVGLAGSASYGGGTFTVRGAGADIWGTADSFHFADTLLSGDGQIVAHVASMDNTHVYAKAGVMFRETLAAGSRQVLLDLKPGGAVEFLARTTTGGTTAFVAGGTGRWLKLVRVGGVFTAYLSADGAAWTAIGSKAVTMGVSVSVGLAVCSHDTNVLNTSVFDSVAVTPASGADQPPAVSITSPPAGAKFAAGSSVAIAASASDADATPVARVEFYANNGTSNALLGADTTSPYAFTWANVPEGNYSLTAVAIDTASQAATSSPVAISVLPAGGGLPSGWADQDIGTVGLMGSASYNAGTFTVQGAGADVWGTADSFNFANQLLSGDGQIVAHVASMQNTHTYAKAGVMFREALSAGSRHVLLDVKPNGSVEFLARAATGGTTAFVGGGTGRWLKLVRANGVFTAYVSADGTAWTAIGSTALGMAANAWAGLAVCSHDTSTLNTALFDGVKVQPAAGSTDQPPSVSIVSPTHGSTIAAGTTLTITANATDTDSTPVAKVDFYANNGTTNLLLGTDATSPYSVTWTNVPAGSYAITAVATDTANQATTSSAVGIGVSSGFGPLPSNWADQDIGVVGVAGSASYLAGTFAVKGAGADIWATADSFNYVSQPLSGDGQITAHVQSMDNTNAYAKAGVMIRETLTPGSRQVLLDVKPDGRVEFLARSATGGATSFIGGGAGRWLKLVRSSGVFTAYVSADGAGWTSIGSAAVTMAASVRAGLAVCSHDTSVLNTAVFDAVLVETPATALSITSPPSGATFAPGTDMAITVVDPSGPANSSFAGWVDLYVDDGSGNRIGNFYPIGGDGHTFKIVLFALPAGTYWVTAVDGARVSSPIRINVSTTPGTDTPPAASVVSTAGGITVTASDRDATPVALIEIFAGNAFDPPWPVGSSATSPYSIPWPPAGAQFGVAIVTDTAGLATAIWF